MPSKTKSKTNVSKSAAAQHQCIKAIQRAADGELQFYSVQKALGNAFFCLRDEKGKDHRGTPRGLFTKGTMLVSVGQIVVAEGDAKGLEIIGVIQRRSEATDLVKAGALPRDVLAHAIAAGAMTAPVEEEDDLFETLAEDTEAEVRGGVRQQRAKADAMRSVSALASRLGSKTVKSNVVLESAAEDVTAAAEHDAFASPKRVKRSVQPTLSIPMRPAAEPVAEQTVWDNGLGIDAEERLYAEKAKPVTIPVLTSWDEEIDVDAI